jgi:hypothetical protein
MINLIVYSIWTEPIKTPSNWCMGFLNEEAFISSWALSLYWAKKNFQKIKIYGDEWGLILLKELFKDWDIQWCNLPNDLVYRNDNWSLGKLWAFKQTEPFIHLDSDAFLPNGLMNWSPDILVQEKEPLFDCYVNMLNLYKSHKEIDFPEIESLFVNGHPKPIVYNTGIIGGTNWEALSDYASKAILFEESNQKMWNNMKPFPENFAPGFFEQCFLGGYANLHNLKPQTVLKESSSKIDQSQRVPFIHLLSNTKRNPLIIDRLIKRFIKEVPFAESYLSKKDLVKNWITQLKES